MLDKKYKDLESEELESEDLKKILIDTIDTTIAIKKEEMKELHNKTEDLQKEIIVIKEESKQLHEQIEQLDEESKRINIKNMIKKFINRY